MIVKTVRAIGRTGGKVLDADDRRVIGQLFVIVGTFAVLVVTVGAAVGLTFRVFDLAAGG